MTVKLHKLRQFGGPGDKLLIGAIYFALFLILLIVLVPILNIIASSFSSSTAVSSGQVGIIPVDFSLEGYEAVFNNTLIMNGFLNSLLYMAVGTIINLALPSRRPTRFRTKIWRAAALSPFCSPSPCSLAAA